MKTLDIQYRQAQSVNIDLGMLDIARTMRAQFCWLIRAYHYLPLMSKGYMAPSSNTISFIPTCFCIAPGMLEYNYSTRDNLSGNQRSKNKRCYNLQYYIHE